MSVSVLKDHRPQFYPVPLDERVRMMVGRATPFGVELMTPKLFETVTERWPITADTPPEVASILAVTKSLFCHGAYVYEFVTVAVHHAFIALEAAFAHRLNRPKDSLGDLISRAYKQGIITAEEHDLHMEASRRIRNGFGHAREQEIWSVGMAAPVIERIHDTIANLWPDITGEAPHGTADRVTESNMTSPEMSVTEPRVQQ